MSSVRHLPPRGHYLARTVGLLAGVPGHTIGQWARRGYIQSSQSTGAPRVYSYQDVAEAMVVHDLLDAGIPHRDIKTAIKTLRLEYGEWPLTHAELATYHGALVARIGGVTYDVGRHGWQEVVNDDNLTLIASQLRRGGWAVRLVPDLEHIEVNPDRLSGTPAIRGRRIAAEKVARMAEFADGRTTLRTDYELRADEIDDAVKWWRASSRLAAAA